MIWMISASGVTHEHGVCAVDPPLVTGFHDDSCYDELKLTFPVVCRSAIRYIDYTSNRRVLICAATDEPMPILPRETEIFPPHLLDEDVASAAIPISMEAHDDGGEAHQWWVLYTLSRREKDLMRRLVGLEVPFYCPLIERKKRSPSGRVRSSFLPLFPGYVFLRGGDEQRQRALTTNCISQTIKVIDMDEFVADLRQIHRLIQSDTPLSPESRIQPGARVRVKNGPFIGLEGTVLKRHSGDRLLVAVEFLQQGASVALDDFQVESLS